MNTYMTEYERLKFLFYLILFITVILFLTGLGSWFTFLILGLIFVGALYYKNIIINKEI